MNAPFWFPQNRSQKCVGRRHWQNRKLPQGLKPLFFKAFYGMAEEVAEKLLFAVIPSGARNLLLPTTSENKADSSARQKAPGFGMTSSGNFSATCEAMP
ncbi:MAG: hypothetical protein HY649_07750 [Acidobacteria bacterium]|nr:hypothetical protein [Acidobacteriota bacterium]